MLQMDDSCRQYKLDQYVYINSGGWCIVSLFVNVTYHLMKYTKNYY